jgi:hypothetical protein
MPSTDLRRCRTLITHRDEKLRQSLAVFQLATHLHALHEHREFIRDTFTTFRDCNTQNAYTNAITSCEMRERREEGHNARRCFVFSTSITLFVALVATRADSRLITLALSPPAKRNRENVIETRIPVIEPNHNIIPPFVSVNLLSSNCL